MSDFKTIPQPEAASPHPVALIKEAYLDPIRSVLIVDDDFPTLDGLVRALAGPEEKWAGKKENAQLLLGLMVHLRNRPSPWLVDVHDGRDVNIAGELKIAPHLHHTDLMILDYHLSGDQGSGEQAIKVLRTLAANEHFNLVVVYTKGYAGDIRRVYGEIRTALSFNTHSFLSAEETAAIQGEIDYWEESDPKLLSRLAATVGIDDYFKERTCPGSIERSPAGAAIREIVKKRPDSSKIQSQPLTRWFLDRIHQENSAGMSATNLGPVSSGYTDESNWICTNQLFVTIVGKGEKPDALERKLQVALASWNPSPHQLLMARMRAEMESRGVAAEACVLDDVYVQAGWLSELVESETQDRRRLLERTINRHWEALGERLEVGVKDFANRLLNHTATLGWDTLKKLYINPVVSKEQSRILASVNCANSTKAVVSSHLRTGQIFRIPKGEGEASPSFWICLSPPCDLVPGQKISGWFGRIGEFRPFVAVELKNCKLETALKNADQNIYLFLSIQDEKSKKSEIKAFGFHPDGNLGANPAWEHMFAANQGQFAADTNDLKVLRCAAKDGTLATSEAQATVVAQLRYEYALNLLQRLSGTFSRVGLDFKASPPAQQQKPVPKEME